VTLHCFWERGGSRRAMEAPSAARLECREPRSMGRDVARVGARTTGGERSSVRRLGRCCPVPDHDLFAANSGHEIHLNAWSSRKYVMVIPRGLIGISSLGTWDLKRKTKFAVYRSRFSSLWSAGE